MTSSWRYSIHNLHMLKIYIAACMDVVQKAKKCLLWFIFILLSVKIWRNWTNNEKFCQPDIQKQCWPKKLVNRAKVCYVMLCYVIFKTIQMAIIKQLLSIHKWSQIIKDVYNIFVDIIESLASHGWPNLLLTISFQ